MFAGPVGNVGVGGHPHARHGLEDDLLHAIAVPLEHAEDARLQRTGLGGERAPGLLQLLPQFLAARIPLRPRFSPDGKRIAFTSHRDGNAEIYVINADGSNLRRLTHNPERDDYPAWHPDNRRLVYVSERDGKHDLYMIRVDG